MDKRDWNPSFNKNSTDPFGCYYFDSILTLQNPKYSSASYEDIDEVFTSQTETKNIIYIGKFTEPLYNIIKNRIYNGQNTVVISDSIDKQFLDYRYDIFYADRLVSDMELSGGKIKMSKVEINNTNNVFEFPMLMLPCFFYKETGKNLYNDFALRHVLATCDSYPIAIRYYVPNSGSVTFICDPLLFTNYGILYNDNYKLILNLLSPAIEDSCIRYYPKINNEPKYYNTKLILKDKEYNEDAVEAERSQLALLFEEQSFIIAMLILLLTGIIYVIFAARRRQRIIPYKEEPKNRTISFIKQISTMYYVRNDWWDLLRKKIVFFNFQVNELTSIDLRKSEEIETNAAKLSSYVNSDKINIQALLMKLDKIRKDDQNLKKTLNVGDMMNLVYKMNYVIKKLKNK